MRTIGNAAIGIALTLCVQFAAAQRVPADGAPRPTDRIYVQATGESTVSVKPDQAVIDIGVVTQGQTAVTSAAQNAKQTEAVMADLRKLVGSGDQLKTASYSVRPNYQYPKPGAPPTISGYIATNVVEVKLDDLALVGKVIDAVLQSGANTIQKLDFGLKNPQSARSQALREAAAQARAGAEAIASGLGVHILRVLSAEESAPEGIVPRRNYALAASAAPPTQIEAGTVEVHATVTLRVEVSQ